MNKEEEKVAMLSSDVISGALYQRKPYTILHLHNVEKAADIKETNKPFFGPNYSLKLGRQGNKMVSLNRTDTFVCEVQPL
jgi:hypothetical protein